MTEDSLTHPHSQGYHGPSTVLDKSVRSTSTKGRSLSPLRFLGIWWCIIFHHSIQTPLHGKYICNTCQRVHKVNYE